MRLGAPPSAVKAARTAIEANSTARLVRSVVSLK
jgi:hypothetical protein